MDKLTRHNPLLLSTLRVAVPFPPSPHGKTEASVSPWRGEGTATGRLITLELN